MRKKRVRVSLLITAGLIVSVVASSAPKAKQTAAKPAAAEATAGYVGTKQCLACHVKFQKNWAEIPHNKILTASSRKQSESGCEACHGPGKTHTTTDRKKIIRFDEHDFTSADAACLKCHGPRIASGDWKESRHSKIGLGCLTCHDPHKPKIQAKILRNPTLGNCIYCHGPVIQAASEGKHHKLPEGVGCTKCHTPHGSKHGSGLLKPRGELCKGCHGEGAAKPESHKAADFNKTHGKIAKAGDSSCISCHNKEKFCNACHGIEMPHPEGFMMQHRDDKAASLAADSKCFKCHERQKSCICHGTG